MYFPHAFQKMLIGTKTGGNFLVTNENSIMSIASGQVGVVDSLTHETIAMADPYANATYATHPMIYLAQGSFHANDKLGASMHGGYKEPVKTKGINPKYVSEFYVTEPAEARNNIWEICSDSCALPCETTYRLRLDIKGSPVLRTLTKNLSIVIDGYTGCCTDPGIPNAVDPTVVLLQWMDNINENPLVNPFVRAYVTVNAGSVDSAYSAANTLATDDATVEVISGMIVQSETLPEGSYVGTVTAVKVNDVVTHYTFTVVDKDGELVTIADNFSSEVTFLSLATTENYTPEVNAADILGVESCLIVEAAYVDTKFGDCSFSPTDHYEIEPIRIGLSPVDETGDPCVVQCLIPQEVQAGYQGKGYGDPLLREYIMSKRYMQEPWVDDVRIREVLDNTSQTDIDRNGKYYVYHILHSVPRKSNPSGMLDNDQYLIKIVTTARNVAFEGWMNAYLTSANNGVQLKVLV